MAFSFRKHSPISIFRPLLSTLPEQHPALFL
jgi:hypothetical protein